MANTKLTPQERLAKLEQQEAEIKAQTDEKLSQLKARKKAILAREKAAEEKRVKAELYKEYNTPERRARTRRLIEIGAEVEAALGFALDTPEMRKALGEFLIDQNRRGNFATKWVQSGRTTPKGEE